MTDIVSAHGHCTPSETTFVPVVKLSGFQLTQQKRRQKSPVPFLNTGDRFRVTQKSAVETKISIPSDTDAL